MTLYSIYLCAKYLLPKVRERATGKQKGELEIGKCSLHVIALDKDWRKRNFRVFVQPAKNCKPIAQKYDVSSHANSKSFQLTES